MLTAEQFKHLLQKSMTECAVGARTELCEIMSGLGSDKGSKHNYTLVYSNLLQELRDKEITLLEIGIGTNRPELISSMGVDGKPGASLRGWKAWMPNARIWGADVDPTIMFKDGRIDTFVMDQLHQDPSSMIPSSIGTLDVIIDDGLHDPSTNLFVMRNLFPRLTVGGFYIIEDLITNHPLTTEIFAKWNSNRSPMLPRYVCAYLPLPHSFNKFDNNLFVAMRTG